MEFDNDRIIKHTYRIEIFYWVLLALMEPLVNSFSFFWNAAAMWPLLLLVNSIMLPAYIFYSVLVVPKFLFKNLHAHFTLISIAFFIIMLLLVFAVYSLILNFDLSPAAVGYFSFSDVTIARAAVWIVINMSQAAAIAFIKKERDETDIIAGLQKDNSTYKVKYLRAQLNPHFLFNTLNSIYSLCLQKSDKAPDVVVKLSDLMRYLIYDCEQEKIPLNKEIEFIRNYIEIEKIRFKADVRFTVEGDTKDILIEPFLFISFIENGFKHAFDNSFTEPFIFITIKVEQHQVVLNVINNTSIDLETQAKRMAGKGLSNSKNLLELLYPSSYALNIIQTEKEERMQSSVRMKNARERLETLYPDSHTLAVILGNNTFTVSLILKPLFT